MSTQDDDGIAFSIRPEETQDHFRLLELPPDLLELLMSKDPPTLQFKSPEDPESGTGAVICTPDKTYNIRQVNTSNSVYVCQPHELDDDDDGGGMGATGLQAIAQSNFTLELEQAKGLSAVPYLRAALPTWASTSNYQSKDLKSKREHFDNIPLSEAECEVAWTELACFEPLDPSLQIDPSFRTQQHPPTASSWLPTASAKVQAWREILSQADAEAIDLTTEMTPGASCILAEKNEDWPQELCYAIIEGISSITHIGRTIDETKCLSFVGTNVLAASSLGGRSISTESFLRQWKDSMPEKWRGKVSLDVLSKSVFRLDDGGKAIAYIAPDADGAAPGAATEAKTAVGTKRKWHDKFRASKKTG